MTDWARLERAEARLANAGLNLQSVVPTASVKDISNELFQKHRQFQSLLIVGSTGGLLWSALTEAARMETDPVDQHCRVALHNFVADLHSLGVSAELAWTSGERRPCPVVELGELALWSQRSKMGLGISVSQGLWFAYRGVVLVGLSADGEPRGVRAPTPTVSSPCVSCQDSPCVTSCPVGAVGGPGGLDLRSCFEERERPEAVCGERCLSRLSCPVGAPHRYSLAQIAHHHEHAKMPPGWREMLPPHPPEWKDS